MEILFNDPERLRIQSEQQQWHSDVTNKRTAKSPKTRCVNGESMKGPLPLNSLSGACKLPGKSHLPFTLDLLFALSRTKPNEFVFTTAIRERFRGARKAKSRGLSALKAKGLIVVIRQSRKNHIITVANVAESPSTNVDAAQQRMVDNSDVGQSAFEIKKRATTPNEIEKNETRRLTSDDLVEPAARLEELLWRVRGRGPSLMNLTPITTGVGCISGNRLPPRRLGR